MEMKNFAWAGIGTMNNTYCGIDGWRIFLFFMDIC